MDYSELFSAGYDPPLWYDGYDQSWILGAKGPPWRLPPSKSSEPKKPKKDGPIVLYVPLCCDGCVAKVYKKLKRIEGVATVECNVDQKKVVVTGPAEPAAVLEVARQIKQGAKLWKAKYPPRDPPRRKGSHSKETSDSE